MNKKNEHKPVGCVNNVNSFSHMKDADGKQIVAGIFAAVPYCIDLIGGPYIETNEAVCKAFRPKSAIRQKSA